MTSNINVTNIANYVGDNKSNKLFQTIHFYLKIVMVVVTCSDAKDAEIF